jgi:hypothetical protein
MSADDDARLPRILLAWELGQNFGHVSKTATVAGRLAGRARLFVAVKDAAAFRRVAPDLPCTLLPAPFHLHGGRPRSAPSRSYTTNCAPAAGAIPTASPRWPRPGGASCARCGRT